MSVKRVGKQYFITVPTFRSSKDITTPEDIIEELLRFYGFDTIPLSLARINAVPIISTAVPKVRLIKNHLAFHSQMQEVENYMLYDNDFLKLIHYTINSGVKLANSLSQQRDTLVTSLVPHLLQNVHVNIANHDTLRFFEWARDWSLNNKKVVETRRCAGIFFDKKEVNFYEVKEHLTTLFTVLSMPIEWKKSTTIPAWSHKHQAADLYCGSQKIGFVGRVSQKVISLIGAGDAWIFELDGDQLLAYSAVEKRFVSLPKFQASWLDISMMVPLSVSVATLKNVIKRADVRIFEVHVVDIFKKDEWTESKSITMRFGMRDELKTLSKEAIDTGVQAVHKAVQQEGAQVR
jgi:phenylalanyl-tRNA synthetase beta chain